MKNGNFVLTYYLLIGSKDFSNQTYLIGRTAYRVMSMKSKWTKKSDACSAMLNLKRRKLKILTWLWCTKNKISANALFVKFVSLRSLCCKNILQQLTKIN